jgi:hypothetical protein
MQKSNGNEAKQAINNKCSSPSFLGAGGFLVAQLVRMLLLPSHWPFIAAMALSASCNIHQISRDHGEVCSFVFKPHAFCDVCGTLTRYGYETSPDVIPGGSFTWQQMEYEDTAVTSSNFKFYFNTLTSSYLSVWRRQIEAIFWCLKIGCDRK